MQRKLNGPPPTEVSETSVLPSEPDEPTVKSAEEMIKTGLTALATARSMQTRRLAIVQDDPNVTKVVKLAQILREIYAQVTSVNGKKERCLHSTSGACGCLLHCLFLMYFCFLAQMQNAVYIDNNRLLMVVENWIHLHLSRS